MPENKKLVALTFDDGPSPITGQVLDILEKYHIIASFFLIGNQIREAYKPVMERQLAMGCELGNHSYTHSDMTKMTAEEIRDEITHDTKLIKSYVNYDVNFFRPPYNQLNQTMYDNIDLPFIMGMGCEDWVSEVSAEQRIETVLRDIEDGTIILLHDFDGNVNTVKALPSIIEGLKEQGYDFVTVSQLFEKKGVNPKVKNKLWNNVLR